MKYPLQAIHAPSVQSILTALQHTVTTSAAKKACVSCCQFYLNAYLVEDNFEK
jgi:hypothetical protein